MIMAMWVVIVVAVLMSALLIYMEHEWGFVLGGATAAILVVSYFSAGFVVFLLPQASSLDAMAITAGALLVLALVAIAYRAGRKRASTKES